MSAAAWARRIKEMETWARSQRRLTAAALAGGYHSAEFWDEAWPRPFPPDVKRAIVRALVEIHQHWQPQLARIDSDAYLGLWLFTRELAESQVVAAVRDQARDYAARHGRVVAFTGRGFYKGAAADLARFQWTRHAPAAGDRRTLWVGR